MDMWVTKWQHTGMYAGVKGGGADLAWMGTSLDQELADLEGLEYLLGMVDIWKCYDQLIPLLIHAVLALAGLPALIIGPIRPPHEPDHSRQLLTVGRRKTLHQVVFNTPGLSLVHVGVSLAYTALAGHD